MLPTTPRHHGARPMLVHAVVATALALASLPAAAACGGGGGDRATGPAGPISGTYVLRTVNNGDVPKVVAAGGTGPGSYIISIVEGGVVLGTHDDFILSTTEWITTEAGVNEITITAEGDYARNGSEIALIATECDPACPAGTTVTMTLSGSSLRYAASVVNPLSGATIPLALEYRK